MTPYYADDHLTLYGGDCRDVLRELPAESVHCVVTSPPYWGLRDYGTEGQLGLEATPEAYVANMVDVFREVRRVLRDDGTLWLNLGDSYANDTKWGGQTTGKHARSLHGKTPLVRAQKSTGLKAKDLVGIPWRVAFALQADGWYLRSDIIWSKPNPMPESVTDRPTKAHEYLFLLSKSPRYYFDADAVRERALWPDGPNSPQSIASPYGQGFTRKAKSGNVERKFGEDRDRPGSHLGASVPWEDDGKGRNIRTVWTIATEPYPGAHFATFPRKLVEPCVKAGCPEGGTVLDPFAGSGTTLLVAQALGRRGIGIDLSPDYLKQAIVRASRSFGKAAITEDTSLPTDGLWEAS